MLAPQSVVDAATIPIALAAVPAAQVREGAPRTGWIELVEAGTAGPAIGVWEHTPGVSTDVESDEVFVVLSGQGTLAHAGGLLELRPGTIGRLSAGTVTVWTITETLRKVYVGG
jgi:uncharacterized cupin superfamily protein